MPTIPSLVDGTALQATDYFVISRAPHNSALTNFRLTPVELINATNLQISSGVINTIQNIATASSPTFAALTLTAPLTLTNGGTNASLTASNGGIVWSNATQLQVLAGTATANQLLLSGATATPAWSTSTYPATNAISTLLYASSANVMAALATANNGLLVTGNTGIPSILGGPGTTGNILQSNAAAAPSFSTATYPATTTINRILYSSSANVVAGLATANSGVFSTTSGGVPQVLAMAADGNLLIGSGSGAPTVGTLTGTANQVVVTNGANTITLSTPQSIATGSSVQFNAIGSGVAPSATAGTLTSAPPASTTTTNSGSWATTLTKNVALRNTTGYDLMCNIGIVVTASTAGTILLGVGSSATPTTDTAVAAFTVAAFTPFQLVAYVPNNYYLIYNTGGTSVTVGSVTMQSMAV